MGEAAVENLQSKIRFGILTQLVERINGIEEVTGLAVDEAQKLSIVARSCNRSQNLLWMNHGG